MPPLETPDPNAAPVTTPAPAAPTAPVTPAPAVAAAPAAPVTPAADTPVVPGIQAPEVTPDVEKLSQEELDKKLEAAFKGEAPEAVPVKKEEKPPETTPPPTPAPAATPAAVPEPAPEKLFAGKYKTEADLEKGVTELAKKLGVTPGLVQVQLDAAKEAKNYDVVEKLYKAMESELGKKAPAPPAAPAAPAQPAQPAVTTADDKEFLQAVTDATFEAMGKSQVVSELMAQGLQMPRTLAELNELRKVDPAGYVEFKREFQRIYSDYLQEGRAYSKAIGEVEAVNKTTTDSEITKIRSFAEANGLKLTDEEIKAITEEAAKSPVIFEDRHGVQFIREGGIYKWWLAEKFPERLEEMKLALKATARGEAVEDLKRLQTQTPGTISTAAVPGVRTEKPKPDLTKEEDVKRLSDEELDASLKKALSGER